MALAEVYSKCGRHHLFIAGVVVATEGDLCRDTRWPEQYWTNATLRAAALIINSEMSDTALANRVRDLVSRWNAEIDDPTVKIRNRVDWIEELSEVL